MKLRQDHSDKCIARSFGIERHAVMDGFIHVVITHYGISNEIPKKWCKDMDEDTKNKVYAYCNKSMSPFYKALVSRFQDPDEEQNRIGAVFQLDSTKIACPKSKDKDAQQRVYFNSTAKSGMSGRKCNYSKKSKFFFFFIQYPGHFVTITNATTLMGEVVYSSSIAASIAPRMGDAIQEAVRVKQDQNTDGSTNAFTTGLTQLIKGSKKYFAIIVVDKVCNNIRLSFPFKK